MLGRRQAQVDFGWRRHAPVGGPTRVDAALGEMAMQQPQVAAIGLEAEIQHIADHRHHPDHGVDAQIGDHPGQRRGRDAEPPGLVDDVGGERVGNDVADAGDQPDDAIEPDAKARAGNPIAIVEPVGELLDPAQRPLEPSIVWSPGHQRRAMIQTACTMPGM